MVTTTRRNAKIVDPSESSEDGSSTTQPEVKQEAAGEKGSSSGSRGSSPLSEAPSSAAETFVPESPNSSEEVMVEAKGPVTEATVEKANVINELSAVDDNSELLTREHDMNESKANGISAPQLPSETVTGAQTMGDAYTEAIFESEDNRVDHPTDSRIVYISKEEKAALGFLKNCPTPPVPRHWRAAEFESQSQRLRADSRGGKEVDEEVRDDKKVKGQDFFGFQARAEAASIVKPSVRDRLGTTVGYQSLEQKRVGTDEPTRYPQPAPQDPKVDDRATTISRDANADIVKQEMKPPNLVERIIEAVAHSKKKGDLAVIIDMDDLSKTVLLPFDRFPAGPRARLSTILGLPITPIGDDSIKFVSLLQANEDLSQMPDLTPLPPRETLEYLKTTGLEAYSAKLEIAKTIKREEGASVVTLPSIDWMKAYEIFFACLANAPTRRLAAMFHQEAGPAAQQIQGVIAVAKHFEAHSYLENVFDKLQVDFCKNKTLWPAIAEEPTSWLMIGLSMKAGGVYEEALRHLVGRYPDISATSPQGEIPKEVRNVIETKSRALCMHRYEIDQRLLTTTLMVESDRGLRFVSYGFQPAAYHVVSIWRDWVAEHISYLREPSNDTSRHPDPKSSTLCEHEGGECLKVAGLYRSLSKGGDSYLPAEKVIEQLKKLYPREDQQIRQNLSDLKKEAAKIVEPLLKSTLQFAGRDQLDYLTCVSDGELPWSQEEDEDMEDC